ncbi:SPOR domain-containing protein [Thalassomonas sp. RHCl1]|uniref:SPOR domain-containing protein n=1 Tax=Thalassomonas sp. RHCl1 TaxID=2995320 RepID=UPI00248CB7CE|nr:SPOR domain-containing protein [Thalassomonas sp. RHCl1]
MLENKPFYFMPVTDDQLLIVNLRLNGQSVAADMEIYQVQQKLLLPLSVLQDILKLPLKLDENQLNGNSLDDNIPYALPVLSAAAPADKSSDKQGLFFWTSDDFDHYFDAGLLNLLLNSEYHFDYSLQQISFQTDIPLAILKKASQEVRTPKVHTVRLPDLVVADNYHLYSHPTTTYNLKHSYNSATKKSSDQLRLNSFFDLFAHSTQLRINQNNDTTNQFLRFSRQIDLPLENDPDHGISYQFGDIQSQRDELIHNATSGAGLHLSNTNPAYNSSFSTITLEEPALPGWEAELYRNGQFVATAQAGDDNRIVFDEVDTFYGNNLFEIKLYGPQGQQKTRSQSINVGSNLLKQGNWNYLLEYVDANQRFIGPDPAITSGVERSAKTGVSYGLSDNFTLDVNGHYVRENNRDHYYLSSNFHGLAAGGDYNIELAKDLEQGTALFAGFSGNLSEKVRLKIDHSYFDRFVSALHADNALTSRSSIKLNGTTDYLGGLGWNSRLSHQVDNAGKARNFANLSFSKRLSRGTLSNSLSFDDGSSQSTSHQIFLGYNLEQWRLSTTLDWYPFSNQEIKQIRTDIRWPQQLKTYNQTQLRYNPNQATKYNLSHNFTYRHKQYNFQLSSGLNEQGDWQLSLGISGTLGYDHTNNELLWLQPQALNAGVIEATAFIDSNRNNIFDHGEQPLQDIGFNGHHKWSSRKTNLKGKVLLPSTFGGQKLSISEQTLPDPFLQAQLDQVLIHTHNGGINHINMAVVAVNDIEGTIYQSIKGKTRASANQSVTLIDSAGEQVAQTLTEVDGYFVFSKIPPGQYRLSVNSELISEQQLEILNLPNKIIAPEMGDAIVLDDILLADQQYITGQNNTQLTDDDKGEFYIQLGAFANARDIASAVMPLQAEHFDVQIYYHQHRQRYYLVAGPYLSKSLAQSVKTDVATQTPFKESLLLADNRYQGSNWHHIYTLRDLDIALKKSHNIIKNSTEKSYFCQLASYRAFTSINPKKLFQEQLLITKRRVKEQNYYSFIAGPFNNEYGENCTLAKYSALTPEKPRVRARSLLQQELSPL